MGELSNTTINGVSYDFKDAGAARQSHSHTKSQITDFPTSMPASDVSAWAKASSKPSYTASEVGAVPNTAAGVSAAINLLSTGDSAPTDNDYYVSQYAGGGTSTTTYHRRPVSKLWEYIKSKLASKGSATQPVYFSNGVPVATTYTLGKSVPADAKFTDTTYSDATTSAAGLMSAADKSIVNSLSSITWEHPTEARSDVSAVEGGFVIIGKLCIINMEFKTGTAIPPNRIFTNFPPPSTRAVVFSIVTSHNSAIIKRAKLDYSGAVYSETSIEADLHCFINLVYVRR